MPPVNGASNAESETPSERVEYSVEPVQPRKRSAAATPGTTSRVRVLYFMLATGWGFAIGAGGLAAALSAVGQRVAFTPGLLAALVPAVAFAAAGGWVASSAYREARNRLRR